MRAAIHTLLAELHFAGMAQTLDRVLDGAEQAGDPPAAVLLALLGEESRHRQERSLAYRHPHDVDAAFDKRGAADGPAHPRRFHCM